MRNLTTSQLLRLAVQRYGELLGIERYYERVKAYEWKIKKASKRSEAWQHKQYAKYRTGIEAIESGQVSKAEALEFAKKRHKWLPK